MSKTWICRKRIKGEECGQIVIADTRPAPIRWTDDHTCAFEQERGICSRPGCLEPVSICPNGKPEHWTQSSRYCSEACLDIDFRRATGRD